MSWLAGTHSASTRRSGIVTVLDIGSSKICCIIGRLKPGELFQYAVEWGSGRTREIHSISKPGQGSRVA